MGKIQNTSPISLNIKISQMCAGTKMPSRVEYLEQGMQPTATFSNSKRNQQNDGAGNKSNNGKLS